MEMKDPIIRLMVDERLGPEHDYQFRENSYMLTLHLELPIKDPQRDYRDYWAFCEYVVPLYSDMPEGMTQERYFMGNVAKVFRYMADSLERWSIHGV